MSKHKKDIQRAVDAVPDKKGRGGEGGKYHFLPIPLLFFLLSWMWASWWMGDVGRIARERSFFATDSTLMLFLWQQEFGSLWILGRALLTLFRWPLVGGAVVAAMLSVGSWLTGYCLRLRPSMRWMQYLPAASWMTWVAWSGFDLYYQHESGRPLGILLLGFVVVAIDGFIISTFSRKPMPSVVRPPKDETRRQNLGQLVLIIALTALPAAVTSVRHPYLRPVTKMEVQMMNEDWQGMANTARSNAELSYRPIAAYYAIALARQGRLADDLFQIRLDYDTLYIHGRGHTADLGSNYYITDCNYHAGLFRVAEHNAMEQLTMDGPSLYSLKHLARLAILHSDFTLADKYLQIISKSPFESAFVKRYKPMLGSSAAARQQAEADPVFADLRNYEPLNDTFESQFQEPIFLGYNAVLTQGRSMQALHNSMMANLYSKRMPDFLMRCEPLIGQPLPQSVREGLVTQAAKNQQILQAFPALQMDMQRYRLFIQNVNQYFGDRPAYALKLFPEYKGYYPYYYFFGNLKSTRKAPQKESASKAGVN
ncbi:MAG: DUF6057 family protein [Bacteroidaceae bacterium]|nr:DUF6057 family protein [Bacteroidaceae bacterium]